MTIDVHIGGCKCDENPARCCSLLFDLDLDLDLDVGGVAVSDDELEGEVAVTWNVADAKVLNLSRCILSKQLVSPQVPHLDELVTASHHAQVLQLELKILPSMLSPVHDRGDGVTARDLGSVHLGVPPESLPSRAAQEASGLG